MRPEHQVDPAMRLIFESTFDAVITDIASLFFYSFPRNVSVAVVLSLSYM